jgi:hypothetical protein
MAQAPVRPIFVALPQGQMTLEQSQAVLGAVLAKLNCGGCYSGRDINFINEIDYFVTPEGNVLEGEGVTFS